MAKKSCCKGIEAVNKKLAEAGYELELGFLFPSGDVQPVLAVVKKDSKTRKRPPVVAVTYCPFCGTKVEP